MQITEIQDADIDAVLRMAAELSAHEGMPEPDLSYEKLHDVLFGSRALVQGRVAHHASQPVGYILWNIGYDMQNGARTLNIIDLFVRAAHRRKGVARSLLQGAAAHALKKEYRFITVQTFDQNEEANAFYTACGAKLDKTKTYYFTTKGMSAL